MSRKHLTSPFHDADLSLRIGMHSGPVNAGVLRGDRARFQLFGDTVNTGESGAEFGIPTCMDGRLIAVVVPAAKHRALRAAECVNACTCRSKPPCS
jgi:Adenylate and Guanylate cyclase catalytic domain